MSPSRAYADLLAEARRLLGALPQAERVFAAPAVDADLAFAEPAPERLPVVDLLPASAERAAPSTQAFVDAILARREQLDWRRTYAAGDGLGEDFLAGYGWFNLISPDGPFFNDDIRVAVGHWSEGVDYPAHAHQPEELYVVLAGGATFYAEGRAPRRCGPGDVIRHAPLQAHGMRMEDAPLLAMGVHRGEALSEKSTILPGDPLGMSSEAAA